MRVLRFMSAAEAIKLLHGETLENDTDHKADGNATTSKGFCFAIVKEDTPEAVYDAAKHLSGITIMDVCVVATLKKDHSFVTSKGRYATGYVKELCTTAYGLYDFTDWQVLCPTNRSGLMPTFSGNWQVPYLVAHS